MDKAKAEKREGPEVNREILQVGIGTNWWGKIIRALAVEEKMAQPCGVLTQQMIAVTPEGKLYPSQEMAFNVELPDRAPGTREFYCVGDLYADPVLDKMAMTRTSLLKSSDMRPPAPFDCNVCVAKSACIGGCHCRYVGQDGVNPENRFDVPSGYCPSKRAAMHGLLRALAIGHYLTPKGYEEGYDGSMNAGPGTPGKKRPDRLQAIEMELRSLRKRLDTLPVAILEGVDMDGEGH